MQDLALTLQYNALHVFNMLKVSDNFQRGLQASQIRSNDSCVVFDPFSKQLSIHLESSLALGGTSAVLISALSSVPFMASLQLTEADFLDLGGAAAFADAAASYLHCNAASVHVFEMGRDCSSGSAGR